MKTIKDENYSREHTKERIKERYNIPGTDTCYNLLCIMINNNIDCKFISEELQKKNPQQVYDVVINGKTVRVVWDKKKKYVKTVLPPGGKL